MKPRHLNAQPQPNFTYKPSYLKEREFKYLLSVWSDLGQRTLILEEPDTSKMWKDMAQSSQGFPIASVQLPNSLAKRSKTKWFLAIAHEQLSPENRLSFKASPEAKMKFLELLKGTLMGNKLKPLAKSFPFLSQMTMSLTGICEEGWD